MVFLCSSQCSEAIRDYLAEEKAFLLLFNLVIGMCFT